jgi:hypothetical protein
MAEEEEIAGKPGVMMSMVGPTGASGDYMVNAAVNAADDPQWTEKDTYGISDMMEGQGFYEKDRPATRELVKFVTDTNHGYRAYQNRARASGKDYLESDEAGAKEIENVIGNIFENVG